MSVNFGQGKPVNSNSTASTVYTMPDGTGTGSWLMVVQGVTGSTTITAPSDTTPWVGGSSGGFGVFTKYVADISLEPASYTFTTSSGLFNNRGTIYRLDGVDAASTPVALVRSSGTGNPVSPTVTATTAGQVLLSAMQSVSGTTVMTVPGTMTQLYQSNVTNTRALAAEVLGASGATGTRTWTGSTNHGIVSAIVAPAAVSPPRLVGSTGASIVGSTTIALPVPPGLAVGHLMTATIATTISFTFFTPPAGWTASLNIQGGAFYKIADAADVAATDFTFTINTAGSLSGVIEAWADVDPTTPVAAVVCQRLASSATPTVSSVTATNDFSTNVSHLAMTPTSATITPPSNGSALFIQNYLVAGTRPRSSASTIVATGATGTRIWTLGTAGISHVSNWVLNPVLPSSPATGSASITLSASASGQAPASATALLSLAASAVGGARATATAALALSASATARAVATASAALTLGATATAQAPNTGTASLTLGASAAASASPSPTASLTLGASATAAVQATATASLTLGASAVVAAPVSASGSLSLGASATASASPSPTASITLGASASATAPSSATASLDLAATGLASGPDTVGAASLTLSASASAGAPAGASGSLSLSAGATAAAPTNATASLTLGATGAAKAPVTATGSITLGATANAAGPDTTASGSLTLGASATGQATTSATGSLSLNANANARAQVAAIAALTLNATAGASAPTGAQGNLILSATLLAAALVSYAEAHIELNATGNAYVPSPAGNAPPDRRTLIYAEDRTTTIRAERRTTVIQAENRTTEVR